MVMLRNRFYPQWEFGPLKYNNNNTLAGIIIIIIITDYRQRCYDNYSVTYSARVR